MLENNSLGVMQGRLLPKFQGRYQAHPVGHWHEEFYLASDLGLNCIEFILDYNGVDSNPLFTRSGSDTMLEVIDKTGVKVETVCADYFMEAPLHSSNQNTAERSVAVMRTLVERSSIFGVSSIVLPCVDQSSLLTDEDFERFIIIVKSLMNDFENYDIFLSLETDLKPDKFLALLDEIGSEKVGVNYDIGNSAALGFDMDYELETYGKRVTDVHIKDRVYGGGPVLLGTGDAKIECCLKKLSEIDYRGPLIMQAYRDDEGASIFKQQLDWVIKRLGLDLES